MKWLTLEWIKAHSRIDFDCEDTLLELYGDNAEDTVLNIIRRSYTEVVDKWGSIPNPLFVAALLLVETSYTQRAPITQQNVYTVPYAFDMMVKPYMRLASPEGDDVEDYVATLGDDLKILVTAEMPDGMKMADVDWTVKVVNISQKDKEKVYQKSECIETDKGDYVVLVKSDDLGIGRYMVRLTSEIPDTDWESGYRKQVVKINPHVVVTG